MSFMETYRRWLEETEDNEEIHGELVSVQEDPAAIEDRFYRELEFGTGGLRGVLGAGSNRMNVYTVGKATQGYSNYLKKNFPAAEIFAANGIQVHLYPKLMPTPSLSFAVRDLHCSGGIVITASHNPAKYNGYKVYGSDGCQITTEAAKAIQQEIDGVDVFADVPKADFQAQLQSGRITYIGEDTVERYLAAIATASVLPASVSREVSIAYTPLNGTGISCVPRCLKEHGFTNITIPDEQKNPAAGDGPGL